MMLTGAGTASPLRVALALAKSKATVNLYLASSKTAAILCDSDAKAAYTCTSGTVTSGGTQAFAIPVTAPATPQSGNFGVEIVTGERREQREPHPHRRAAHDRRPPRTHPHLDREVLPHAERAVELRVVAEPPAARRSRAAHVRRAGRRPARVQHAAARGHAHPHDRSRGRRGIADAQAHGGPEFGYRVRIGLPVPRQVQQVDVRQHAPRAPQERPQQHELLRRQRQRVVALKESWSDAANWKRRISGRSVSYTHLTLPTSDLV